MQPYKNNEGNKKGRRYQLGCHLQHRKFRNEPEKNIEVKSMKKKRKRKERRSRRGLERTGVDSEEHE
jgi:hypothetical protein